MEGSWEDNIYNLLRFQKISYIHIEGRGKKDMIKDSWIFFREYL